MLDALPFLKIDLPADRQSDATHIQSIEVNDLQSLDGPTQKALVSLWSADVFKEAVSYGQSFQLNDSATCASQPSSQRLFCLSHFAYLIWQLDSLL